MAISIMNVNGIDFIDLDQKILATLLVDKTTTDNILWATNDYAFLGNAYSEKKPITIESITGSNSNIIQPRVIKSSDTQWIRQKRKAEVFTPAWVCNQQNNLIDDEWFQKKHIFNSPETFSWKTIKRKIPFGEKKGSRWQDYVDAKRIEITCGEAPYLASRYDMITGEFIQIPNRIGLLDRKLRVVYENTTALEEWIIWATRAIQSTYGFEYQGDNLIIARENILLTFIENMQYYYQQKPNTKLLLKIANIIAWNIWQMDGTTYKIPFAESDNETLYCKIHDWRSNKTSLFLKSARKDTN